MVKGSSGQFDVVCDGRMLFSRRETGRFPVEDEVEEKIAALREGRGIPAGAPPSKGMLRRLTDKVCG